MRDGYASAVWADDDFGFRIEPLRKRPEEARAHTVSNRLRLSDRRSDSIVGNDQLPVRPTRARFLKCESPGIPWRGDL
jgi:hypothetical protein